MICMYIVSEMYVFVICFLFFDGCGIEFLLEAFVGF